MQVTCPYCQTTLNAQARSGQVIRCSVCGGLLQAPAQSNSESSELPQVRALPWLIAAGATVAAVAILGIIMLVMLLRTPRGDQPQTAAVATSAAAAPRVATRSPDPNNAAWPPDRDTRGRPSVGHVTESGDPATTAPNVPGPDGDTPRRGVGGVRPIERTDLPALPPPPPPPTPAEEPPARFDVARQQTVAGQIIELDAERHWFELGLSSDLPVVIKEEVNRINAAGAQPGKAVGGLPPGLGVGLVPGEMSYARHEPGLPQFARFAQWYGTQQLAADVWETGAWRRMGLPPVESPQIRRTFYFAESTPGTGNLHAGNVVRLTVAPRVPLWRGVQVVDAAVIHLGGNIFKPAPRVSAVPSADGPPPGTTRFDGDVIGLDAATSTFSLFVPHMYRQPVAGVYGVTMLDWQRLPYFRFGPQTRKKQPLRDRLSVRITCRPGDNAGEMFVEEVQALTEITSLEDMPTILDADDPAALIGMLRKSGAIARHGQVDRALSELKAAALLSAERFSDRYYRPDDVDIRTAVEALAMQDIAGALEATEQTAAIAGIVLPEEHWLSADARQSLRMAEWLAAASAEDRQQLAETRRWRIDAGERMRAGQLQGAIPLLEKVAKARGALLGTDHELYAIALCDLARLHARLQDYAAAQRLYEQTLDLRLKHYGPNHPATAVNQINLAYLQHARGNRAQANDLAAAGERFALSIWHDMGANQSKGPEGDGNWFMTKNHLEPPLLFFDWQDQLIFPPPPPRPPSRTVPKRGSEPDGLTHDFVFRLPVCQKHGLHVLTPAHDARTGLVPSALAGNWTWEQQKQLIERWIPDPQVRGAQTQAGMLLARDLSQLKTSLEVSDAAADLRKLASAYASKRTQTPLQQIQAAMQVQSAALALPDPRRNHQPTAGPLADFVQILQPEVHSGRVASEAIPLATLGILPAEDAYARVLAAKGAQFIKQRQRRAGSAEPTTQKLMSDLRAVTAQLSSLAYDVPPDAEQAKWRKTIGELSDRREAQEAVLGGWLSCQPTVSSFQPSSLRELRQALPAGSALVDYVSYLPELSWGDKIALVDTAIGELERDGPRDVHRTIAAGQLPRSEASRRRRLAAFVLRPQGELRLVDLGALSEIQAAASAWLDRYSTSQPGSAADRPELRLRELVWSPLEPYLGDARLVLVSPDENLARVPLAALPGRTPGRYLIEELELAVTPAAQMIPHILATGVAPPAVAPAAMLLGNVDYHGGTLQVAQQRSAVRQGIFAFAPLPGTAKEMDQLAEIYRGEFQQPPTTLQGLEATEERVVAALPGKRIVHLATHGFFAPEKLKSTLFAATSGLGEGHVVLAATGDRLFNRRARSVRYHPGLLSGIALSGANCQPDTKQNPSHQDGILTAAEVAELDLQAAELVVLSACQTALGEAAEGEGLLGLQRAFQVAGAKTVIASLWEVDDSATQTLMTEFYRNRWQRKLGSVAALREAQLTMLHHFDSQTGTLRGVGGMRPSLPPPAGNLRDRLSPFYWAAFVVSGDWR